MNQANKKIGVGVIGTGYFSRFHYAAWKRMADVELVAMHAMSQEQGKHLQSDFDIATLYTDVRELIADSNVQLVDIVTPPQTHKQIIDLCMQYGKTVVCQKPFCNSVSEASALVSGIKENNALVVVHENFRFQPWYQEIKQILADERLGQLYEINFDFRPGDGQGPSAYLERQPYFQQQKRFFIQETGIHFIDVFRFLMGDITGLFASLQRFNPVIKGEDAGIVVMEFASGARGVLNGNRLSDHAAENCRLTMGELRIDGSAASLYLNGSGQIYLRNKGSSEPVEHHYAWQDIDFGGDCVFNTNRHVVEHILHGNPIHNTAVDYIQNRVVEQAVYTSHEQRQWISLNT